MHDVLDFLFVDTTACMLDVLPFACRSIVEDGVEAAVLMVLSIITVLSAGTISASDNR